MSLGTKKGHTHTKKKKKKKNGMDVKTIRQPKAKS
jgi:hypothetical protein